MHFVLEIQTLCVHLLHGLEMFLAESLIHIDELIAFVPLDFWDERVSRQDVELLSHHLWALSMIHREGVLDKMLLLQAVANKEV